VAWLDEQAIFTSGEQWPEFHQEGIPTSPQRKKAVNQERSRRTRIDLEAIARRAADKALAQRAPKSRVLVPSILREQLGPIVTTVAPDDYIQVLSARGEIVNISTEKLKQRLADIVRSIDTVAQTAANAGRSIASKVSNSPFELDEITVGLTIGVKAGAVVVGVGGDVNLALKFVRMKGAASPSNH
jgi:hypothetical protein